VLRSTPDKFGGLVLMFGTIVDLFLVDMFLDETTDVANMSIENSNNIIDDMDSEVEDDSDAGSLYILFFLGGSDIDEPYTELASVLTLLQFLEYFEIEIEEQDN